MKTLTVLGANIRDVPSFYAEINRVFMAGETWLLGESLDALNDMFYGGDGAISGREPVRIVWQDIAGSKASLGFEATRAFLQQKLRQPGRFNADLIGGQLDDLERGCGKTYFEIVIEILADHPNIELAEA